MEDVNLQEATARLDGRIDTLANEMKAGFDRAFVQTQGGFDDFRRFVLFLDERVRKDMNQGFSRVERRFEAIETRLDRMDQRFDGMDDRFDRMDDRFDRMDQRFDEVVRLIKER